MDGTTSTPPPRSHGDSCSRDTPPRAGLSLSQERNTCPLLHCPCGACGHEIRLDGTCGCEDNRHPVGPGEITIRGHLCDQLDILRVAMERLAEPSADLHDVGAMQRVAQQALETVDNRGPHDVRVEGLSVKQVLCWALEDVFRGRGNVFDDAFWAEVKKRRQGVTNEDE